MFISVAQKIMGNTWDIYSSGGGCYHARKEFASLKGDLVAVEVHWSGCSTIYEDGDGNIVNSKQLEQGDFWCNCLELVWCTDNFDNENNYIWNYDNIEKDENLNLFSAENQEEIIIAMKTFVKSYDDYMYHPKARESKI